MTRLEAQAKRRSQNVAYLTKLFNEFQGINGLSKGYTHRLDFQIIWYWAMQNNPR